MFSDHAQKRIKQRGISNAVVELIYEYGREDYDNHGDIRIMIINKMIESLKSKLANLSKLLERARGIYLVVSAHNGIVVTAGHRYK
jgi:hypothetical protein